MPSPSPSPEVEPSTSEAKPEPTRARSRSRSPRRSPPRKPKNFSGLKWKSDRRDDRDRDDRRRDDRGGGSYDRRDRRDYDRDNRRRDDRFSDRRGGDRHPDRRDDGRGDRDTRHRERKPREPRSDKDKKPTAPPVASTGEAMIIVTVNDRLGTKTQVPCLPSDPVKVLKAMVAAKIGRPVHEIMLKRQGERPFHDQLSLADYSISNGVQIDLELNTGD
ncbi:ubiquitin-related domain-containing protein [Ampelomyces quisqualis]|uniref:Ubiquitin-like modifier HUB1 n=1 Tax=Ampelomyces quisqualis TaxID=50730 RepID=A0A6A5QQS8_AMPQU|nr:ubiquitin-related domain-containing protein [Ampelomyces quisqualis]